MTGGGSGGPAGGEARDAAAGCRRRGRLERPLLVVAALAAAGCAQDQAPPEPTGAVGPAARPSFEVRLDSESSAPEEYHLVEDDDGIRVQTGPAGIAYRSDDAMVSGDFQVEATFLQYDAPLGYREAYGIFVGGRELQGADQEYTYLLVRPTGDYLIKRRIGEITETFVDWTPDASVARVQEEGDQPLNTLGIRVLGADTEFVVNGVTVQTLPTARVRPHGVAGVRVNHRLDVRVDDWILEEISTES